MAGRSTDAVLIVNPHATRVTPEIVAAVERELGEVETLLTEGPGHATALAAEAAESAGRIYVLSGDGGFNEVVNGLEPEAEVEVGFLPGGGTSVLPRALGLPRDATAAARALASSSRTRRIGLGRVNGRRFTFSAGVGFDAELVRAVDALGRHPDGRRPGDTAYTLELLRVLAAHRATLRPSLTVLDYGRAAFALAANCDPYSYVGPVPLRVAPRAAFELGIDVTAPTSVRPYDVPRLLWWALVRPAQTESPRVISIHDADEVTIECDRAMPLQVDGEDIGDVTGVRLEAERDALSVIVSGIDSA